MPRALFRGLTAVLAVSALPLFAAPLFAAPALAAMHGAADEEAGRQPAQMPPGEMPAEGRTRMGEGLMMPRMDAARGRRLFATKGCVVCHAINGVGGQDAQPLDAATMPEPMNPFQFAARMWRGAEAMIYLQREELGEQISFTGDELADLIAFTHDAEEQQRFSPADIPPRIAELMEHLDDEGEEEDAHEDEEVQD